MFPFDKGRMLRHGSIIEGTSHGEQEANVTITRDIISPIS